MKRSSRGPFFKGELSMALENHPSGVFPCPVARRCAGCQMQNLTYPEQLLCKQRNVQKTLSKFGHVETIIGMKDPTHYRNKVQAAFRQNRSGRIISGVYQSADKTVVPVDSCLTEDAVSDRIIVGIRKLCTDMRLPPYDERTGRGLLRHVLVRRGFKSGQIMVVLVTGTPIFPLKKPFTAALIKKFPEITTVIMNVNKDYDGLMLGPSEQVLHGKGTIEDTLLGLTFRISSRSFYQINPVQTEVLYTIAMQYAELSEQSTVLDAYCGIGTIGLIAAKQAGSVIGFEKNADAVKDAVYNKIRNSIKNAEFLCADAGTFLSEMKRGGGKADVVFMDPPRAGADRRFLSSLLALGPRRIIYISCNPVTLARDLSTLCKDYRVERMQPVDLFPYTNHTEMIIKL